MRMYSFLVTKHILCLKKKKKNRLELHLRGCLCVSKIASLGTG